MLIRVEEEQEEEEDQRDKNIPGDVSLTAVAVAALVPS